MSKLNNRCIVNIRGCNGAGKSSIPMSMLDDSQLYVVRKVYQGKERNILTVFPSYGWVALGTYFNKTGGLDCFPDTALTKKVFWYALKHFPQYNMLFEGVISSTVFSTYADLLKEAKTEYPKCNFFVVSLLPPVETCLKRIQKRNGGKPIKEDLVRSKWETVKRNSEKFTAIPEIQVIEWDNTGCKKKDKPKLIEQLEDLIDPYTYPF